MMITSSMDFFFPMWRIDPWSECPMHVLLF